MLNISSLPQELLDWIFHILFSFYDDAYDKTGLNIRLTCKDLAHRSKDVFGKNFCSHLNVLLHPKSFQILREIAHQPDLAKHVRKFTISGESGARDPAEYQNDLVEALRKFTRLQFLQIGTSSFHKPDMAAADISMRCGRKQIKDYAREPDWPVYELVLQALVEAEKHNTLTINLTFPALVGSDVIPKSHLSMQHWVVCAPSIRQLSFFGNGTELRHALFSSSENLTDIALEQISEGHDLDYLEITRHVWSQLRSFELLAVNWNYPSLIGFLSRHQNTLEVLRLLDVHISKGTWKKLLEFVADMPHLTSLGLYRLVAESPEPTADYDENRAGLVVEDKLDVAPSLRPTISDFQMMETKESWVHIVLFKND